MKNRLLKKSRFPKLKKKKKFEQKKQEKRSKKLSELKLKKRKKSLNKKIIGEKMQKGDFVKLLSPRVTALIISKNSEGKINAAPYSFVYPFSFDPPLIGVGVGQHKMTYKNIQETKEFTVNIVSEEFGQQAVNCEEKIDYWKRLEKNQLHLEESEKISVPRLKEAKAVLECELSEVLELKEADHGIVVGTVVGVKVLEKNGKMDLNSMNYLMHESGEIFRKVGEKVFLERKK